MSFTTSLAGNQQPSQFVYTTTNISVDNISVQNLSAESASITNLTTTIFSPVNVNATAISTTDLTVTNLATIGQIHTSYIHMSNASLDGTMGANTLNAVTVNADNAIADELYLNEQSSVLTDKSLIKRDANQIKFIGKSNASDANGADFLFRTGTETDAVKLTISRTSDIVGAIALAVDTTIEGDTGIFDTLNVSTLNVSNSFDLTTINVSTINSSTVNSSMINADNLSSTNTSIVNLSVDVADSDLALFSDSSNVADKSRIYRQGNVLYVAQGAVAGDADASIHFYIGPPTGTPPLKIDKNNNKTTAIDFASDDLFSLRGTINTFNSSSIASPSIEGDAIETENLLFNDKVTSNDSFFERVSDKFRFVGSSGITPVDWEFYKTGGVSPLVKIEAANDRLTVAGDIVGNIRQNLAAGTGITLSQAGGITTITNSGSVTDPLNVSQLNASNISCVNLSASNDITALEVRGTAIVSSPILEGGFVDTLTGDISNLSTVNISSTLISTNTINASTVNSSAMTTVSLNTTSIFAQGAIIGATVDADILEALYEFHITDKTTGTSNQTIMHRFANSFEMYNTNVVAPYKIYTGTNTGTPDLEITSTGIVADISPNLAAGTGIQLATVAGVTTITNTGIVTDPLNVSKLNASNISCVNLSASNDITALEVRGTAIVSSPILEGGFVDTLTGDITNLSSTNISLTNATLATSLTGAGNINITGDIQTTGIINTTGIIQTTGAINGGTINGNIAGNLAAGTGINLNTVGGITTISNTGGSVTDPLNLSKLNASNISCDNISAALITGDIFSTLSAGGGVTISQNTPTAGITQISATALSTSTQYAFKAYSTSGDAYSINGATTIPYNSLSPQTGYDGYSIPNTSSYNTAQATYTVPVSGYWYFGYTLRQRTTSTTNALVAIYRNGSIYMINGNYTGNGEGMSITLYADAGDLFYVRSISGSFSVDMRPTAAMFFGFLLQPENNTVTATTNLSIQNLSVSGDITATSITADLSPNLTAGLNMGLTTTAGVTTIKSAQQILSLSLTTTVSPGAVVGTTIIYDTIKYNSGVGLYLANPATGEITVNQSGSYCISAAVNVFNNNYSDRVNFRIRLRVNGSWFMGYPQAYSYSRHQNYARYATSVITDHCTPLMAGDKIDIFCSVAKAQNSNFTSDFSGLQLFNGATLTIKRI